jgi:hypothetical protein
MMQASPPATILAPPQSYGSGKNRVAFFFTRWITALLRARFLST